MYRDGKVVAQSTAIGRRLKHGGWISRGLGNVRLQEKAAHDSIDMDGQINFMEIEENGR